MLDFTLGSTTTPCDGVSRRSFLRAGSLAIGGVSLAGMLKQQAIAGTTTSRKSVILIWQAGGPSHIDMYDLKPHRAGGVPRGIQADSHQCSRCGDR